MEGGAAAAAAVEEVEAVPAALDVPAEAPAVLVEENLAPGPAVAAVAGAVAGVVAVAGAEEQHVNLDIAVEVFPSEEVLAAEAVNEYKVSPQARFIQFQLCVLAILLLLILASWRRHGSIIWALYADPGKHSPNPQETPKDK